MVDHQVVHHLADGAHLVVAWEDGVLDNMFLACHLVFLLGFLHKDKPPDEVVECILGEDVLPHIRHRISVLVYRVALARVDAFAATDVERQECGFQSTQFGGHIDLL